MSMRALMPDYLRLVALFGIVVVNVQYMAFSIDGGAMAASHRDTLDIAVIALVDGLAYLKSYGLFSFMFGVGLSYQIASAERRGLPLAPLYRNRMLGLALLGLLHGILLFPGDILLVYAIIGSVLYFWRQWPVRRLVRTGAALLAVQIVLGTTLVALSEPLATDILDLERAVMTGGPWTAVIEFRSISFGFVVMVGLLFQGISALGWFCLGLAAVRHGLIDVPTHPLWVRARRFCLPAGVLLSLMGGALRAAGAPVAGEILIVVAAPLATLGYLGLIAAFARPPGPWMAAVLKAGGSSLTIYLGQSIVLSTVFSPYGLGLWDALSPAVVTLIALGMTLVLMVLVTLWRRVFAQAPFEWLLGRITRLGVATPRRS